MHLKGNPVNTVLVVIQREIRSSFAGLTFKT